MKNTASRSSGAQALAAQAPAPRGDEFLQCIDVPCGLRFPAPPGTACPSCGQGTAVVATRYVNVPLRREPRRRLAVLFDNVRSAHNVGVMLRTAESVGAVHAYHVGITPPGSHAKVAKAALGSEQRVPHSYHRDGVALAASLVQAGTTLWALESAPGAIALADAIPAPDTSTLVLVVGNEIAGVDPGILSLCHGVVALPMAGEKNSLNVGHAFAIAAYGVDERSR
ncbi:MAG: TrmH family RNA methyltransferase [Myxococcales bacterium]|nr:TrmH family RNA methyltransferase [Myxococcales bacterium]